MGDTFRKALGFAKEGFMPWRDVSAMDQRRDFVRLALLEGAKQHGDAGPRFIKRCA